jgi:hypothetical protein
LKKIADEARTDSIINFINPREKLNLQEAFYEFIMPIPKIDVKLNIEEALKKLDNLE